MVDPLESFSECADESRSAHAIVEGVTDIALHLRDIGQPMVDAWEAAFGDLDSVTVSCGDIFSTSEGVVEQADPVDVTADAIISPANSFGFMDGGIDAVYTYVLGAQLQDTLQSAIETDLGSELHVGQAAIVPTGHSTIPWCISAPTMRVPGDVATTVNAYLAFRAALIAVLDHNNTGKPPITSILCPGLATAVGRMPVDRCARQMRAAWDRVLGPGPPFPSQLRQAADDQWLVS